MILLKFYLLTLQSGYRPLETVEKDGKGLPNRLEIILRLKRLQLYIICLLITACKQIKRRFVKSIQQI